MGRHEKAREGVRRREKACEGEAAESQSSNYKTAQQAAEEAGEEIDALTPLTTKEKIQATRNLTFAAIIAGVAGVTGYTFYQQVFGALSPNVIFNRAFDAAKQFAEVETRLGKPLKAYGRDHGGHREGLTHSSAATSRRATSRTPRTALQGEGPSISPPLNNS